MDVRVARGLFRLWVVLSLLWIVGTAAYVTNSYQTVALRDLKKGLNFDEFVPAYIHCWDYRMPPSGIKLNSDQVIKNDEALAVVEECERSADRSDIIKQGGVIALAVTIAFFVLGWALMWAYKGFLPNKA